MSSFGLSFWMEKVFQIGVCSAAMNPMTDMNLCFNAELQWQEHGTYSYTPYTLGIKNLKTCFFL